MVGLATIELSFKDALLSTRKHRSIAYITIALLFVQFLIFKYFYPYPNFIHDDSVEYINIAAYNQDINTYMVGYSRFLRLFSSFTSSDTILVFSQYIMLELSAFFVLTTLNYFYQPRQLTKAILYIFILTNPLFLHLANLISSDNFFLTLSFIWFASLIWIIHRPSITVLIVHTVVLFIAFTVRYNALLYPIISFIAFLLSPLNIRKKILFYSASVILCGSFILYTCTKYYKLSGKFEYSPFSGWQMANNALYAYRYVDSAERLQVPKKFWWLDRMVRNYFDTTRNVAKYPQEAVMAGTFYMWRNNSPLYKYRNFTFRKDTSASDLKMWAAMAPFYREYGSYLIRQYPRHFVRYFLWPNANKYYAPPVEFLSLYNSGKDSIAEIIQFWFQYKTRKVYNRFGGHNVQVLDFYPIFSGVINMIILATIFCYVYLKGWRYNRNFGKAVLIGGTLWVLNAGFTIFASSAALRFQSFPIIITTIYVAFLIDWMFLVMTKTNIELKERIHFSESLSKQTFG